MLRIRERASTFYSSAIFYLGLTFESFKELGVRQQHTQFDKLLAPQFKFIGKWLIKVSPTLHYIFLYFKIIPKIIYFEFW
jgi:hypothetical protein